VVKKLNRFYSSLFELPVVHWFLEQSCQQSCLSGKWLFKILSSDWLVKCQYLFPR